MNGRFNHAGVGPVELLAALAIGYWLGFRHQWMLPDLPRTLQVVLGL